MTSDLGRMTYGELVAALRKDLLLDASTDVLAGSIGQAFTNDAAAMTLAAKIAALHGLGASRGVGSVAFTGSNTSAGATIAHGLGVVPTAVVCTPRNAFVVIASQAAGAYDAVHFFPGGFYAPGTAITATVTFDWIAIG